MVRIISQETFDEVVRENMEEFSMSAQEAIEEAVQQFEAQGVDLTNIVKELFGDTITDTSQKTLLHTINRLEEILTSFVILPDCLNVVAAPLPSLCEELKNLKDECDKDLAHKVLAGKNGAYNIIIKSLIFCKDNRDVTEIALDAMISLMTGQPDLLDKEGITLMEKFLEENIDLGTRSQIINWIKQCCIKHEGNRQNICGSKIIAIFKSLLDDGSSCSLLVRDICSVIKTFVLDDDVRVEFGKAHEHAVMIANELLETLTDLLRKFHDDRDALLSLVTTVAALVVRNEFCEAVEKAGGLKYVNDILISFPDDEDLNQQCLWFLKCLAGNDDVKAKIIKNGSASLIVSAMDRLRHSYKVAQTGNACIAALSLRSPANSRALVEAGAAEAIIEGMKAHIDVIGVQVKGSWAIRNMVSRERGLAITFLQLGAEDHLNSIISRHNKKCSYDIKSALRDLGCKVQLTEEWTGKGGALN